MELQTSSDWSVLKGEEVLDSDFVKAANIPVKPQIHFGSVDKKSQDSCSTKPTQNACQDREETAEKGTSKVDTDDDPQSTKNPRGSRLLKFAKALRYKRGSKKYVNINEQSDAEISEDDERSSAYRSTWMAPASSALLSNKAAETAPGTTERERSCDSRDDHCVKTLHETDSPIIKITDETSSTSGESEYNSFGAQPSPKVPGVSNSFCFFFDQDLFRGAELVAYDVRQLFTGDEEVIFTKTKKNRKSSARVSSPKVADI